VNRISDIPDWFIKNAVNAAKPYGISTEEASACIGFLLGRKSKLARLIMDNKHFFANVPQMLLPDILL
jgi:hypothetical protein